MGSIAGGDCLMGKSTDISWTDHTFNPWWGCQRVSPGCEHCYAETMAKRYGHAIWGPAKTTVRRFFGDAHWAEPLKWNREAEAAGERRRVFCASMADVFETNPAVEQERFRLWRLIEQTPWLDWLLLTKRPENFLTMLPWGLQPNVWLGTSAEDQLRADERIPLLLQAPAVVRFLSCEPLLGPIELSNVSGWRDAARWLGRMNLGPDAISWVIAGGESGPKARPMHPDWARSLRDQCQAAGAAFHFKQWGNWLPSDHWQGDWPGAADARCYVNTPGRGDHVLMLRVGNHRAGRELDGRTWDQFPTPAREPAPA